ncbi:MAG: ABC transporter ATP-binding protein [Candidatus Wallbacteria bacterium HGW-Wallbacteria-1]|jgi:ATP-binding cassette subfamily F protein 3|uniref:ABC transporter ATP-binding protein n=1 Tax=Candidatus Wallbacteria bacterium HGW-Wallbacteria-1 TaxID=2013854 RepID=A0A2N1PSB8_9BACT|nr:MAG: ABC transporter ATP-binding protein [Candidatus Wallbacteria bacterium HGW-Wallbacteria-1]
MLSVSDLGIEFGGSPVFSGLSMNIEANCRIALVGQNGAGKTTFLRILAGILPPTYGSMAFRKGLKMGFLHQEEMDSPGESVFDFAHEAHRGILEIGQSLEVLNHEMAVRELSAQEIDDYQILDEQFRRHGGFETEARTASVLRGLGFSEAVWSRPARELSGGWRRRLHLGRMLLEEPDLLLLDEPTNHLDTETIGWLENYLKNFSGAIVMVSHDRYFLERATNITVEINRSRTKIWRCAYSEYLDRKDKEEERLRKLHDEQTRDIEKIKSFVDKFRCNASKARQVQSRVKQLEKIEIIDYSPSPKIMDFRFPPSPRTGEDVIKCREISKSFGENRVIVSSDLTIMRNDVIAVVGENGAGKTTLLRILAGLLRPDTGLVDYGSQVRMGYYAQHTADQLDCEKTILEEVQLAAPLDMVPKVRSLLGCFLFTGDEIEKRIGILSGGEKARVALAKMLLTAKNLLIMDEPTNHLDIFSRQVLVDALKRFDGTIVIVSHDRYFLDQVATRVVYMNGKISSFPGNYSEFLAKINGESDHSLSISTSCSVKTGVVGAQISKTERAKLLKEDRERRTQRKLQRQRVEQLEARIAELENSIVKYEADLTRQEVYSNPEKVSEISCGLKTAREQMEECLLLWEEASLAVDS